jgi:hypothetical protein
MLSALDLNTHTHTHTCIHTYIHTYTHTYTHTHTYHVYRLSEEDLKKLMKALDKAEPLPKDVKWTMHMADTNRDGSIQTGIMFECSLNCLYQPTNNNSNN